MIIGVLIAVAVVAGGISYKAARDAQKAAKKAADAMAGVLLNKESNIDPIPVIYGERRVGGVRVYVKTAGGKKNEYLYIALALCEGEIESISSIEIDDTPITDSKYLGLYSYQTFLGTDDQTVSTLLQESGAEWTSDHRLRGVAYIAIRLKWDTDAFSGIPEITAVVRGRKIYDPRSATTEWKDNPALCIRDYLTNNRYGKGLPSSAINDTAFSAAANDLDSFTATPYVGAPSTIKIFKTNIVLDTGEEIFRNVERLLLGCRGFLPYTQGQYALKIDQATSSLMTLDTSTIIGGIKISGSKKEDRFNRVVVKFPNPETDWQPDQAIWPDAGSTEETTYLAEDGGTLLVDEVDLDGITNYYSARDIARILVLRSRNALRVGLQATSEALDLTIGDVVSITHPTPGWTAKPFQVEEVSLNYDGTVGLSLIEYDSSIYAYDPANEETVYPDSNLPDPFTVSPPSGLTVTETTIVADDGTLLPSLRLTWTAADDAFVTQYEIQWQRAQAIEDYGSVGDEYTASENWQSITLSPDTQLDYGSIDEGITTGEPDYNSAFTGTLQYVIQGVIPSANYNIRIRSYNGFGAKSAFITTSTQPQGDTDPPGIPASVTAAGGLKEISLSWQIPTDQDYSHVEVWENTVNNFATATKIAIANGDHYSRTGLGYDVTRYYWLKSADYSGNISDVSAVASATTLFVDTDSFSEAVNNLFQEAGAYGIEPVSSLPATGDFDGQIKYDTTANKLYRWDAATSTWTDDIFSITSGSVDLASFASGIEPVGIVSTLPNPSGYTGAQVVFNTSDGKLYRYVSGAWTAAVPAVDIDGALAASNFPSNLRPIEVVSSLPTTGNFEGRQVYLTTDNKLYRYDGTGWTAKVNTVDLEGTITSLQIANDAVTNAKIAVDAIQGDVIAAGAITAAKILDGAISELKLADDAVTTAKLANAAVTADIVAANAITATNIQDGAISTPKLAAGSITTAKIAAGAVTAAEIAALSITSDKIAAGAVTASEIAAGAITTSKIAAGAVTAAEIAANTITASEIAANAITASEIAANAVTAVKIAADSITSDKITAGAITTAKIAADAITANEIATGAVTADAISAGSVQAGAIAAGAISADKIAAGAITAAKIAVDAVTADKIAANSITSSELAANSVIAGKVAAAAISTTELAANAITADKIAAGVITSDKIAAGTIQGDRIAANTITGGLIAAAGIITTAAQIEDGVITNAKIANLAVDTIKIANGAVTNKYAAYTDGTVTVDGTYTLVQELQDVEFDGASISIIFNCKLDEALSNRFDIRLNGTSQRVFTAGSVVFTQVVSGFAFYSYLPQMVTLAMTITPAAGTYDIQVYSQRADTGVSTPNHDVSQRFLQAVENKK